MTNEKYVQKLSLLKEKLQTLTDELWRNNKEVRNSYINKERLMDAIIEDIFTFEKDVVNIQLEK